MRIEDVARAVGVSSATVSRALNRPDKVSPATRAKVMQAAATLGYVPSSAARTLATGSTSIIGVVVPDLCSPFFLPVISGAHGIAGEHGVELAITDSRGHPEQEVDIINRLRSRVDGLILVSPRSPASVIMRVAQATPIVTINRDVDGVDSVAIDIDQGLKQLAGYMLGRGLHRIGYIGGPPGSMADAGRYATLEHHATQGQASCHYIATVGPTAAAGASLVTAVLQAKLQAVVAYNSLVAYGLWTALKDVDAGVAGHILMASTDDLVDTGLGLPAMTTIRQPVAQAGAAAAALLLQRTAARGTAADLSRQPERRVLPSVLLPPPA